MSNATATPIIARPRRFTGSVVRAKAALTAVVAVERIVVHPLYRKRYRRTLHLACHNPGNTYQAGDRVIVQECRPLSKTKRWRIIAKA